MASRVRTNFALPRGTKGSKGCWYGTCTDCSYKIMAFLNKNKNIEEEYFYKILCPSCNRTTVYSYAYELEK